MEKRIETFPEPSDEKNCSVHKDRPAVAALMREGKGGRPPTPRRYYCQECLARLSPGVGDHGPD